MQLDIRKKIANILNDRNLNNQGLMSGKIGQSIFFYILARKLSNEDYAKCAEKLIDEIFLKTTPIINFKDGIAGIGWGIEYLIQNDFCEGEPDEILEDIDSKIFKFLNEEKEIPFGLQNGLIGYLQYLIMRLKNKPDVQNNTVKINQELLKFIINKIDQLAPEQFISLTRDIRFNLLEDVYIMLLSCISILQLNIYSDKILNMFKQWEAYLLSYIPSIHFNRLYLAIVLFQMNQFLKSPRTTQHIKILLSSVDINQLKSEIDLREVNNVRFGYLGQLVILNKCIAFFDSSYPNYVTFNYLKTEILNLCNDKLITLIDDISKNQEGKKDTNLNIVDNWLGVGLLLSANTEIIDKNNIKL
jgi:hypothetical protein